MTQNSRTSRCSMKLLLHIIDCIALLLIIVLQGSILDYYLILHNGGGAAWYFWFLADFLVLIGSIASAVISYRYYKKVKEKKEKIEDDAETPEDLTPVPISKFGSLPLVYIVWLFYSLLLTAKVILLFKLEIAQHLSSDVTFGPQLLKVIIASAAVVFLLLVETHNDAEPQSHHQAYIYFLITTTVFEIFDSVTFLGILFPDQSGIIMTYPLENAILGLSCVNFILPTIELYKLSTSEFGLGPRPLGLQLLYKLLHLFLINIPYFVIRVYLWTLYDHDVTLFLLKNVLAILLIFRTAYPDVTLWWQLMQENRRKQPNWPKGTSESCAVYEITESHIEERQLDENGKKVPLTTQL